MCIYIHSYNRLYTNIMYCTVLYYITATEIQEAGQLGYRLAGSQACKLAGMQAGLQPCRHAGMQSGLQACRQACSLAGMQACRLAGMQAGGVGESSTV